MSKILIVDDEGPIRESLSYLLTLEGHSVVSAQDGLEALRVALAVDEAVSGDSPVVVGA